MDEGYKLVIGYRTFHGVPLCPCKDPGNYLMLEQSTTDPLDLIFRCWCGRKAKARMESLKELNAFLIKNNISNEEIK